MILSVFIRYVECIPTIKDLVKRLKNDIAFKMDCGFLVSDNVPSEASYSRLVDKLMASNVLERRREQTVERGSTEGSRTDHTVAIEATNVQAPAQPRRKPNKEKAALKSHRRKATAERGHWLQ